jgi:hypothetical protein
LGVSEIVTHLNNFLYDEQEENPYDGVNPGSIVEFMLGHYKKLHMELRAAMNLLCARHQAGILLPLMLVKRIITPSEYANVLLAIHINRSVEKEPVSFASLLGIEDKDGPVLINWEKAGDGFQLFHQDALKVMEYLAFFDDRSKKDLGIQALIKNGESYHLEFKTSFRWDVHQQKKNPSVEHASLKTITAFLNSSGGNLLIGVQDDGSISGIETDRFENDDKFLLHFWNVVKSSLGQEVTAYVQTVLQRINGKTVCRVNCLRSPNPVFLKQKGFDEEFYIRIGPSSAALEIREALKYIADRFST